MIFRFTIFIFLLTAFVGCKSPAKIIFPTDPGNFNSGWEFVKDPVDSISPALFQKNEAQEAAWQKVSLPHTANIELVGSQEKQWQGIVRYRKFFTIPKQFGGKSITVRFDGAVQVAKVYLNGEPIQTHLGGYLPFVVKLDGKVKFGEINCILVELDNRDNPEVPPGKPLAKLDFNYYSGLYRNATIEVKNKLHISDPITANQVAGGGLLVSYSDVSAQSAKINVQVDVENENDSERPASLQVKLKDAEGQSLYSEISTGQTVPVSGHVRFSQTISLKNPGLWSPENPYLYELSINAFSKNQSVDSLKQKIGIRTFSFSAKDGFALDGKKLKLRGTNRHQEYPYIGNALSDNAQYRDAWKIKQAGFNFVRSSHYPQSPAYLDACDKLGILVMDAIPGWQFVGDREFQDNSISDVRQMVRRDRNHPSIILWEASLNESGMPKEYMERAHQAVHEELPFDNVYTAGWIDDVYDVFIPARQHAKPPYYWSKYEKDKPLIIAEYGDWEYYAQNAGFNQTAFADLKQDERTSRQLRGDGQKRLAQQALNYQESHNDNLNGSAAGDANWLMFDYKRGYAPDIESSGIMDIFRLPKFAFYFYASQAENAAPLIYIANYWNDPTFKNVKVYSNCDEVELSLNGKIIGRQKPDQDRNSTNLSHPPFTFAIPEYVSGKLEATGFISGKEEVKTEVQTPEEPSKVAVTVDLSGKELQSGQNDIVFVYASVTDANGTVIPEDQREITFSVEGDAELVGDNPQKAEAGISTVLLKAGKNPGTVKVKASAAGLKSGEIEIKIN